MALQGTPYHPLQQHVDDQVDGFDTKDNLEPPQSASTPKKTYFGIITMIILVISLAGSNGVLLWHEAHKGCYPPDHQPYWGPGKTILKPFHWITEYSDENKTKTSPLWADLFPIGDGLVTLPDKWAQSRQLPASIKRNMSSTESVYFVAAYHQLHCLAIIRSVLYHLKEGVPLTVPFAHATHCLDSLRQSSMCHADDTLLYTEDSHTYGDGQTRLCKDWSALAQWTKEHRIYVQGMEGL